MPKKFANENSKAAAARARKEEKSNAEKEKKAREIEDAKWKDDDKQLQKKQARKEDAEKKRLEALEKKKEREQLASQEEREIQAQAAKKGGQSQKMSRAQIREEAERREAVARGRAAGTKPNNETNTHLSQPLEENINRADIDTVEARTVDEALSVLSVKDTPEIEKHPEKRMKAAYEEFEQERLPQLKVENPTLRLSQLKQLLRKEWLKHPNNPLNLQLAALAAQKNNA